MALDASIYGNLLGRPVRSVSDWEAHYQAKDDAQQARALNALALQLKQGELEQARTNQLQARQAQEEQGQLAKWLQGANPDAPDFALQAYRTAPRAAPTFLKGWQDQREGAAKVAREQQQTLESKAKTDRETLLAKRDKMLVMLQAISSAKDQNSYTQALQALSNAGIDVSKEPPQFDPARVAAAGRMAMTAKERIEADLKKQEFDLKEANELIGPDGKVNPVVYGAKAGLAKAGASNISVSTEKSLLGNLAEVVGKDIADTSAAARDAQGTITTADRIEQAVNSGKVITGTAANQRVALAQLGETLGIGPANAPETLSQTRDLMMALGDLELKAASQMKGQGQITEAERALLKRAAAGDITFTNAELLKVAQIAKKTARARIARNQSNIDRLKTNPNASSVVPFLENNGSPAGAPRMPTAHEIEAERQRRNAARGGK